MMTYDIVYWKVSKKNRLEVNYNFMGEPISEFWIIESIDNDNIKATTCKSDYRKLNGAVRNYTRIEEITKTK